MEGKTNASVSMIDEILFCSIKTKKTASSLRLKRLKRRKFTHPSAHSDDIHFISSSTMTTTDAERGEKRPTC